MTKSAQFLVFMLVFMLGFTEIAKAEVQIVPVPSRKDLATAMQKNLAAKGQQISADDLAQVEAAAKKVSQQSAQIERQANQVKNELDLVNRKMIEAARKIQAGEDEVAQKKAELDKLQQHLSDSEQKFEAEHGMLIETLAALQTLALRPSEAVLIQPLSPVEVMRSSILLRGSVHVLKDRAELIRQSIEDISNQKQEIAKRLEELEVKNVQLAKQQDEMAALSKQKSTMYNQLSAQSKEAKQQAQLLAGQAKDVRDLLNKLETQRLNQRKLEEKQRLAQEREVEKLRQENNYSMRAESKPTTPPATHFAQAKGRLIRPARGPIITAFHQEMSKGVTSNGIDIQTASKAQIIAPFDGTVMFAGPFKNFANLVIIDHGDGYTSLLSGLNETYAEVGQLILAGEPVGIMPSTDHSKLHMEIRKNNHPLNPTDWMAKN